jgi:DNA polymerase-3 subunit epsilon
VSWADGRLSAFDLETSGVDHERDRIVTAVVAHIAPGRDPVIHEWLIAVDVDIPESATAIHGVTTEHARAYGRPAAEVVPEIAAELRIGWSAGAIVVGHNIAFDFSFLDREHRRWAEQPFAVTGPVADSFVLDRHVDKYRKGSRKLEAVADLYCVRLDGAHNATADALAAARVLWRMCRVYPDLGAMDVRDLFRLQVTAKAEQAAGLQDHLRQKKVDAGAPVDEIESVVVDPHWPIIPVPATAAITE